MKTGLCLRSAPVCRLNRKNTQPVLLIDIGERAGSGIPNIFRVWREEGWTTPEITEQLEPERTTLTLTFEKREKNGDKKSVIKIGDKHKNERNDH